MMSRLQRFHHRTGRLIELAEERTTAERRHAHEEFNNGMVFSEKPLSPNETFSVRMNKKITSWSGSIEVGLTSSNPSDSEISKGALAALLFVSGTSVTMDGVIVNDEYCTDLDSMNAGDVIGIMRNIENEVHVFINGTDQGIAAVCNQENVWAMINLYGKCSSISIASDSTNEIAENSHGLVDNRSFSEILFDSPLTSLSTHIEGPRNEVRYLQNQSFASDGEALMFYSKCGSLIRLTDSGTTAVRARHQDEFNNGVVMTNRTLKNDELFEIRINTLTDKWSGSIEMGITTHAPNLLEIPSTMTNLRSGTVMLSGCGIITNGKGTRKEYLDFHLDELKVGDYVGLMRRASGTLHFFINGVDQGVAANNIPPHVYGVVDLYGRAVSVSIVRNHSVHERNRRNTAAVDRLLLDPQLLGDCDPQTFSPFCGKHIELSSCRTTAMRQNPLEDFNHAVVLSSKPLKPGELFSVRIEDLVPKWSGSLEIGITTYSPESLNFPATMTNIRSGTWIMTATGVMINGITVVDDYGSNMDSLKAGDTLGVCRKVSGNLHFFINGTDQGLAASMVPEQVYVVVDLYGQVSKVSILGTSMDIADRSVPMASTSGCTDYMDAVCVNSASVRCTISSEDRITLSRKNPTYFFDRSIACIKNKLTVGQLCEFEVSKIVRHWSGSLEVGVTTEATPHVFPSSLIELGIWVWTGRSTFKNGLLVTDTLHFDLESLKQGSRVGLMRTEQGILGYIDGVDIGVLFPNVEGDVFPVINLYGKCSEVTFSLNKKRFSRTLEGVDGAISQEELFELSAYTVLKKNHRFYGRTSRDYVFLNDHKVVLRRSENSSPVIFSAKPLKIGETFEVLINDTHLRCGSLSLGLISTGDLSIASITSMLHAEEDLKKYTLSCLLTGSGLWINGAKVREFCYPELYSVDYDDRVGIMLCDDETLVLFYNGKSLGEVPGAFSSSDLPHFVVCMGERVRSMEVVENAANIKEMKGPPSLSDGSSEEDSVEFFEGSLHSQGESIAPVPAICPLSRVSCGKNVRVTDDGLSATRVGSYNQAVVVTDNPLGRNILFQVKVKNLDEKWKASLSIGVTTHDHSGMRFAIDALRMASRTWLIRDHSVLKNGSKIKENYGPGLDSIGVSQVAGVLVDSLGNLHLYIDGKDQGVAAKDLPETVHGVVDLYGCCDEIEVVKEIERKKFVDCYNKDSTDEGRNWESTTCGANSSETPCPNLKLCERYLRTLGLPTEFFTGSALCLCQTCFKYFNEPPQCQQGEPPQKFTQPVGWCKFALRTHPNVDFASVSKYWNLAFFSTDSAVARKVLDVGEIPTEFSPVVDVRSKRVEEDSYPWRREQVVLTPNMKFISDSKPGNRNPQFVDNILMNRYWPRLAFQVYVQPSTFKVKSVAPRMERTLANGATEKLEWIIKEPSTTILSHLLVKLDPEPSFVCGSE